MKKKNHSNQFGLPRLVRQVNLQAVIRQMRRMEIFSKIDLAHQSGISNTTMSKLFSQLEEDRLIEKSPIEDKSFGRPKILYQLSSTLQVAGVFIDVDETTICISDLQGEIKSENTVRFPTPTTPKKLFVTIAEEFLNLSERLNTTCRLIGVCIPGLIETESGKSMLCPNINWLQGTAPAQEISSRINLPAFIMHEERALCRAQFPAVDESTNYIAIDFSSGVGMSVVSNGQHISGTAGFAGEIGHIITQPDGKPCGCGNRGCLETIASDRVFQSETGLPIDEALEQLKDQKEPALGIATEVLQAQATGIAAAINIFNPEKVFVYSRLSETYPSYLHQLRKTVEDKTISFSFNSCTIETTKEGKLKGALLLAIDQLIEKATT